MKISWEKEDMMWKVVFQADTIDPSGMSVVGNFNNWEIKNAKTFSNGKKELTLLIPLMFNDLSFKFYDSVYDCWCEVYDNGELYAGLEPYFVRNEVGTTNIIIPLLLKSTPPKPVRKKIKSDDEEAPKAKARVQGKKKHSGK
jgi:hypothetical protein